VLHTKRAQRRSRVLTAPEPNATLLRALLCLPTAPALPPGENGDFGGSPIYGQLSDKPLLAFVHSHGVREMKHNRDEKLNTERLLAVWQNGGAETSVQVPPTVVNIRVMSAHNPFRKSIQFRGRTLNRCRSCCSASAVGPSRHLMGCGGVVAIGGIADIGRTPEIGRS
jgi:hypothetical protein